MTAKSGSVRMPMTSAGIIGIGSDVEIEGIKVDPRTIIIATLIIVGLVKVAGIFIR